MRLVEPVKHLVEDEPCERGGLPEMAERVIEREQLEDWLSQGLSRKQIVEKIFETKGVRVTGAAVSMAMSKWGMQPLRNRHDELIPWRVRTEHADYKEVTFLRKLARRRKGLSNPDRYQVWVENWLDRLAEADAVITYIPDALNEEDVFSYVPRQDSDGPSLREDREHGAVIRRPEKSTPLGRSTAEAIDQHGMPLEEWRRLREENP